MKRRPTRKHSPGPAHQSRALIRVDGTRFRQQIRKEYEKALRHLNRARQELEHFQTEDLPEFVRWLNGTFGALLTELRETSQKIQAQQQLLFEIENEVFFSGTTYARAYQRVMWRREHPEPVDSPPSRDGAGNPDGFESQTHSGDEPPDDAFNADAEDLFEEAEAAIKDFFGIPGGQRSGRRRPEVPPSRPLALRLKQLYRALARRLHPDTQESMTVQKLEWWHQTQTAYKQGDAEQLEVILTLCEIDEKGNTDQTSASLLQRITRQLKTSLGQIKSQLAGCRRDPAWDFARRTDRDAMAVRLRRSLEADLYAMKQEWQRVENQLAQWAASAARQRGRKPPRRAHPDHAEFFF